MAERAQVRSIETLEGFRARLIVYLTKARAVLEEASDEKQRTRVWLESDRRTFWEAECRRRALQLQTAQQELFTAKLSRIHSATAAQLLAVERAQQALRQAEAKRDAVKLWTREFETRAEPLAKQIDQLQSFLATDLTRAVAFLGQIIGTLEAYSREQSKAATGSAPQPAALTDPGSQETGRGSAAESPEPSAT